MVRNYKKKTTNRMKYSEEDIAQALVDVTHGSSLRAAAARYKIPYSTLHSRHAGEFQPLRKIGRQTVLLKMEEFALAQNIVASRDFGFALDLENIREYVKFLLDSSNRTVHFFTNNLPGQDWVRGFLKRHENILTS